MHPLDLSVSVVVSSYLNLSVNTTTTARVQHPSIKTIQSVHATPKSISMFGAHGVEVCNCNQAPWSYLHGCCADLLQDARLGQWDRSEMGNSTWATMESMGYRATSRVLTALALSPLSWKPEKA